MYQVPTCARRCDRALYLYLFSPYNNWSRQFPDVSHEEFETQRGEVASLPLHIHVCGESGLVLRDSVSVSGRCLYPLTGSQKTQ